MDQVYYSRTVLNSAKRLVKRLAVDNWEKRFDKKFGVQEITGVNTKGIGWYPNIPSPTEVKKFIAKLLRTWQQRKISV